jgi:hypothetical protein
MAKSFVFLIEKSMSKKSFERSGIELYFDNFSVWIIDFA